MATGRKGAVFGYGSQGHLRKLSQAFVNLAEAYTKSVDTKKFNALWLLGAMRSFLTSSRQGMILVRGIVAGARADRHTLHEVQMALAAANAKIAVLQEEVDVLRGAKCLVQFKM